MGSSNCFRWVMALMVLATIATWPGFARAAERGGDGAAREVLSQLVPHPDATMGHEDGNLLLGVKSGARSSEAKTRTAYDVPLVITLEAQTDAQNIRLEFAGGEVIFNWEVNQDEFRIRDPRTGEDSGVRGQGRVPTNTWVTVRWTINDDGTRVEVNGVERFSRKKDYKGVSGPVGIGTLAPSHLTVRSLRVSGPGVGADASDGKAGDAPLAAVEVEVPAAQPPAGKAPPATAPSADIGRIDRPEYTTYPKRLVKGISSIRAMTVITGPDGQATGVTTDIIATVPPGSRSGTKAGAGFYRPDGDRTMKTSFEEALRAVTMRYPLWEPGHVDFSFGEKFTAHAGPSAGTAFALLTLSCLEGFDVDPKCAVTGDVSVDWRVRKVGGVTAKLRGAALDKCLYAAIPEENAGAFTDMALLYGNHALWDVQVFSIANLQEAAALVRTDRPPKLAEAIRLFADLKAQLEKAEKVTLHSPATRERLKRVLELAPNHLSALRVLALCDGTAPKTLSAGATDYQLSILLHPYLAVFADQRTLSRETLPRAVTLLARKRLDALRPIANKDYQPALREVGVFIETIDQLASQSIAASTAKARLEAVVAHLDELGSDPELLGKLYRDGY